MYVSVSLEVKFMLLMVCVIVVIGEVERFSQVRCLPVLAYIGLFLIIILDLALFI